MKYLKINRDQTNIVTQNGQNKRSKKKKQIALQMNNMFIRSQ